LEKQNFFKVKRHHTTPAPIVCSASTVVGDKLIVYGGHEPRDTNAYIHSITSQLWAFSFSTKMWEEVKIPLPELTEHSMVTYNGFGYVFGGYGNHNYSNQLIQVDFNDKKSRVMKTTGSVPSPRSAHSAVVYLNYMIIYGGWTYSEGSYNDLFVLDFNTFHWEKIVCSGSAMPKVRAHACTMSGSDMYIFGGYNNDKHFEDILKYDIKTNQVTLLQQKFRPSGRSRIKAVCFENMIYTVGGYDRTNHFDEIFQYDIRRNSWKKIEQKFPTKIAQYTANVFDEKLWLFGGFSDDLKSSMSSTFAMMLKS